MAAVTAELIEKYSPSLVLLVGIAAGRKMSSAQFGDVIVPGMILDFSTSGAHGTRTDVEDFAANDSAKPDPASVTYALRNVSFNQPDECRLVTSLVDLETFHQMLERYSAKQFLPLEVDHSAWRAPKILDGVLASANVLSRARSVLETLAAFNEQVRGTEMEAAGFATACERARVSWAIGKAISDWGNEDKVDGYHKFAATTSAVWARCLLSTCLEHGMIFEQGDRFSALAKLKAIQSMLAYIGARIEAHNPALKMNIQIYRIRKTPDGQFLTQESGWSYHGDPGIRSAHTASLMTVPVKPRDGKDLCICVAARLDPPDVSSSVDCEGGFYFSDVKVSDREKYPAEAINKVSDRQRWIVAYRIMNGSNGYVLSHSGSNPVFKVTGDNHSKSIDAECVLPVFQREWGLIKPVLVKLLDSNA